VRFGRSWEPLQEKIKAHPLLESVTAREDNIGHKAERPMTSFAEADNNNTNSGIGVDSLSLLLANRINRSDLTETTFSEKRLNGQVKPS
jgi:hypothetical protein